MLVDLIVERLVPSGKMDRKQFKTMVEKSKASFTKDDVTYEPDVQVQLALWKKINDGEDIDVILPEEMKLFV